MEVLLTLFSVLYMFWPMILFFGFRSFFIRGKPFADRVRNALGRIFVAWLVWAFFYACLHWQQRQLVLIFSPSMDQLLFFGLGIITGGITIGFIIFKLRENQIRLRNARTLEDLLEMSPDNFEALTASLFEAFGHRAEVSGGNSDHGVDVVVWTDEGEKWVVQCKRYAGSVGEPVVRDLYGTMLHEDAQAAYLITTGTFSRQAVAWAVGKPIVLYDGEGLIRLIRRVKKAKAKKAI